MTHRQFRTWQVWLTEVLDREPDLTHWYIMQLTSEVRAVLGKREEPKRFKLDWKVEEQRPAVSSEQATAMSQARWFGITGYSPNNGKPALKV